MWKHRLVFVGICLVSPTFWLFTSHISSVLKSWNQIGVSLHQNFNSSSRDEYAQRIIDLRWGGQLLHRENVFVKIVYNPIINWANQGFEFLEFATPKLFFLSGDGGVLTPLKGEPIPFVFFPFWIIGITQIVIGRQKRIGIALLIFTTIGFLVGKRNFEILFFAFFIHIAIVTIGINMCIEKLWVKK